MISFENAYKKVLDHSQNYGNEAVSLNNATGRVLAENIVADRDFPPYDRSTKDGIAINFKAFEKGQVEYSIQGTLAAGAPQSKLNDSYDCLEIMTGAVLPENTDTVIMYEHIAIKDGKATVIKPPILGQNIHYQGGDEKKGAVVLHKNRKITAAEVGVLASVGKSEVLVKKLPKITLISTGNELVDVHETPLPHQIRKSNMHTLTSALKEEGILPSSLHLLDEKHKIEQSLEIALKENDVLLLSGGVSKGKYDFIPDALQALGVQKVFHRVLQRPGKPFWFGVHKELGTVVFSFPGNPASTFANYTIYFKDWFNKTLGLPIPKIDVILKEDINIGGDLTRFIRAEAGIKNGKLYAKIIHGNGSGDLTSLVKSNGFIKLAPKTTPYKAGDLVPFIAARSIL
ncbi:molybdopterin molybdotransferase [Saonia flava]|uniref:Molybdopterin molybdenumtransferase n=2 Tax=Saonia flava TaxID=523696 RepID=A0A846QP22_9FLAO|nr:molybdopterin molybdotransferase [Saonia flava]